MNTAPLSIGNIDGNRTRNTRILLALIVYCVYRFRIYTLNYTAEDESVLLRNLPNGNHVLTLLTDKSRPDSVTSLSHVVVF